MSYQEGTIAAGYDAGEDAYSSQDRAWANQRRMGYNEFRNYKRTLNGYALPLGLGREGWRNAEKYSIKVGPEEFHRVYDEANEIQKKMDGIMVRKVTRIRQEQAAGVDEDTIHALAEHIQAEYVAETANILPIQNSVRDALGIHHVGKGPTPVVQKSVFRRMLGRRNALRPGHREFEFRY